VVPADSTLALEALALALVLPFAFTAALQALARKVALLTASMAGSFADRIDFVVALVLGPVVAHRADVHGSTILAGYRQPAVGKNFHFVAATFERSGRFNGLTYHFLQAPGKHRQQGHLFMLSEN
jgi:hypothetical protein